MMDLGMAFNLAISVLGVVMGWFVKSLFDRIQGLEDDQKAQLKALGQILVDLPTNYARRDDLVGGMDKIFDALRRIEDKVDRKADRT
jgi:hypothetical protein